ncbi:MULTISPECIES: hypothetical protein [unclassified Bradyrhizobium]|uniref:hypothetical protein n=1 Tax=unclassified Bradyrhizobium TaxID=2631580 RepID=UPI003390E5BA
MKYDARSGRIFRMDRAEKNGSFENEAVDITLSFKAIAGFDNMEAGWILFAAGAAPGFTLVRLPLDKEFPARPSDKHKHGVRLMIKLAKDCGGDKPIREMAGTSKAFLSGVEAVYTQYLAEKDDHPGKLPVIVLEKTTPVRSGTGDRASTNYQPTFKIVGWAARGDLGGVAPPDGSPPATGSTPVEAPKAAETVSADEFG